MKLKFFSVMAIFLISFGFLGTNSIKRLGASELSEKTMTQIVQEEQLKVTATLWGTNGI